METFLHLVDTGKPFQSFKKLLGLTRKFDIAVHLRRINLYREVVRLSQEIRALRPNSSEQRANRLLALDIDGGVSDGITSHVQIVAWHTDLIHGDLA